MELFVRTTRGLPLTDAATQLQPHAEATLAAAEEARAAVRGVRDLQGGTVSFGTFNSAHHFILDDLLAGFRSDYPNVRLRVLGRNSSEIADAVGDRRRERFDGTVGSARSTASSCASFFSTPMTYASRSNARGLRTVARIRTREGRIDRLDSRPAVTDHDTPTELCNE